MYEEATGKIEYLLLSSGEEWGILLEKTYLNISLKTAWNEVCSTVCSKKYGI